ncbi:hypothetical protein GCM10009765_02110 [Fodinicola feengrottensis]|uniref:Phosphoenolpyruvate synthase n=1 Tax=Fodinicola feengrottensis TaxID=435914 RepID=A0ABN2FQ45_9ACTN
MLFVSEERFVVPLDDPAAELALVGGKGASLARLAVAGLPVPPGFHLSTAAYRAFVAYNSLQDQILAVIQENQPDAAAERIAALFAAAEIPAELVEAIVKAYALLGDIAVAVRSSATAEDLPELSFAGQQDTYLNIRGETAVVDAVKRCWASLWTARAIGYRARHQIGSEDVALAVVVQELVPADAAGVMFTVDPVTGDSSQVLINAAWGLGEAVVSGLVTPDTVAVDRESGAVVHRRTSEKAAMTVRTADGTQEQPVPVELRRAEVLTDRQACELSVLGVRIEKLYERPMDIEWAVHQGRPFIVQARPITGLPAKSLALEAWNDSLDGDYLWTNANLGEAVPSVMTPATWSLMRIFMSCAMATTAIDGMLGYGQIGGRLYMNLSMSLSIPARFGVTPKRILGMIGDVFGRIPEGVQLPIVPLPRVWMLRRLIPTSLAVVKRVRANKKILPELLAAAPTRFQGIRARIEAAATPAELGKLWDAQVHDYFLQSSYLLEAATKLESGPLTFTRTLRKLVGEADTNALLTGLNAGSGGLASLGPLLGLAQVARGEMDAQTYARDHGHRCPDEFEVSVPRPAEDPHWLDRQLAGFATNTVKPEELLARQLAARTAAWERLEQRFPKKAPKIARQLEHGGNVARGREHARSEVIRGFWAMRIFLLRAGELTGHGDDVFFLSLDETLALLAGDERALAQVPARRETYRRYSALPPYPAVIRGAFDPFEWAADPDRRGDVFDATDAVHPVSDAVTGFPGALGVVDGVVRVLTTMDEGDQLQPGEILVTTVTNVGWTPLFPRAAAVVTDVGAPLSHAAIVARELGIPAVVGCGNATMRLHTGDHVRVDGEHGTVTLLAG